MKLQINDIFGRLTIISKVENKIKGHKQRTKWNCLCSCGNSVIVSQDCLVQGHTKSCGCLRKEIAAATLNDLTSQIFNQLTVLESTSKRNGENIIWHCRCSCGNFCDVAGGSLTSNHTKSCGCLQKKKASKQLLQANRTYRLSKGYSEETLISAENNIIRSNLFQIKQKIRERDNYKCALCLVSGYLNVHHIELFSANKYKRFEETNLICLCRKCHKKVHNNNFRGEPNEELTKKLKEIIAEKYSS